MTDGQVGKCIIMVGNVISKHSYKMTEISSIKRNKYRPFAIILALILGVLFVPTAFASAQDGVERGPEEPAIYNEFAEFGTISFQTHTVTLLPNGGGGNAHEITTDTGTITLPNPETIGFSAPAGSVFVGWSTDRTGRNNVYSQEVIFPDNANHTAALDRDAELYAIWLPSGDASSGTTAYFYIRADGTIPFEPAQGSQSAYIPAASGTTLKGSLRQPVAVTNNPEVVAKNLREVPNDQALLPVLQAGGISYDPLSEKIVWYVIKSRQYGGNAWNVDGVIVPRNDYMVYYNPNGGYSDVPMARAYLENSNVTVDFSTVPTRPGFDFLGWANEATAVEPNYPLGQTSSFTMPSADKYLYAVWSPRYININYQADPPDGGNLTERANTVRAYDGDGVTGSDAASTEGYLFEGWYKGNELVTQDNALNYAAVVRSANRLHGAFADTTYTAHFVRAAASMEASKEVLTTPANGKYFVEGEDVSFRVVVSNTGNVKLTSVVVEDTLGGSFDLGDIAPEQSAQVEYVYRITAEDVARGYASNEASINAKAFDGHGNPLAVPEQVVGIGVLTGVLQDEETYVLYGVYPVDGGSVGRDYEIVNADTAEGLTDRTAVAEAGYHFAGWYEDDVLISNNVTLTVDEMREALNRHTGSDARAVYTPTLFIAHFVPDESKPSEPNPPIGPTDPDTPDTPDNPNTPNTPNIPNDPNNPSDSVTPGDLGVADDAVKPIKPIKPIALNPNVGNAGQSSGADDQGTNTSATSGLPPTGDDTARTVIPLIVIAVVAVFAAFGARRADS